MEPEDKDQEYKDAIIKLAKLAEKDDRRKRQWEWFILLIVLTIIVARPLAGIVFNYFFNPSQITTPRGGLEETP